MVYWWSGGCVAVQQLCYINVCYVGYVMSEVHYRVSARYGVVLREVFEYWTDVCLLLLWSEVSLDPV